MSSRVAGVVCLAVGGGLTWWVWQSALTYGVYDIELAAIGAMVIPVGIGYLIHGERLPRRGITRLTRIYLILGALAAVLNLHLLGADRDTAGMLLLAGIGLALVVVSVLPARMLGPIKPQEVPPTPQAGVSNEPIEPR